MRNFIAAVLLGLGIGGALAAPAHALDVTCQFPNADEIRPCSGNGGFEYYSGITFPSQFWGVSVSDASVQYVAMGATPQAERWLAQSGAVYQPVADRKDVYSASCDWNQNGIGTPYFGKCKETGETPAPVVNVDQDAEDHARQTWEWVRDNGGCDAPWVPVNIAKFCWGKNWSSEGGSD